MKRYSIIKKDGRFSSPPSHSDEEGKRHVNDVLIAGILFPASSLAALLSIMIISPSLFPTDIILMAVSMSLFIVDIDLWTGALGVHIGEVETLTLKTGN